MAYIRPSKTDDLCNEIMGLDPTAITKAIPKIVARLAPTDRGGQGRWASSSLDAWKMAVSRLRKAVSKRLGTDHPAVPLLALPSDQYEESNRNAPRRRVRAA